MSDDDERKTILSCAAGVLQRLTAIEERAGAIEGRLAHHITTEEKTQNELKWGMRFLLSTLVLTLLGAVGYLIVEGPPWL